MQKNKNTRHLFVLSLGTLTVALCFMQGCASSRRSTLSSSSRSLSTTGSSASSAAAHVASDTQKQHDYMVINYSLIQKEMAQGSGETIDGLADVLGCPTSINTQFAAYTQERYSQIFDVSDPDRVLSNVKKSLAYNHTLSVQCALAAL